MSHYSHIICFATFVVAVTAQHEHHHTVPAQVATMHSHGHEWHAPMCIHGHINNALHDHNHVGHEHKQWHGHEIKHEKGHEQVHKQEHWHTNSLGHRVRYNHEHKLEPPHMKQHGYPGVVAFHDPHGYTKQVDYNMHPKYEVEYNAVDDHHTGDPKPQYEQRVGEVFKGFYRQKPNGPIRHYHGDNKNEFYATFKYSTPHVMPAYRR